MVRQISLRQAREKRMPHISSLQCVKLSSSLGLLAVLLAGAYACAGRQLFSPLRDFEAEQRQGARLDAQLDAFRLCREARRQIAAEVIEQRLTLWEAAARFRDLDGGDADATFRLRHAFPGKTDEERYCWWVICLTGNELQEQGHPDRAALMTARLKAELQEHRERDGVLRLPEPRP
jgi:hypothetical protein